MKRVFAVLLLLLIAGQAEASVFFKIVEVPAVQVSPGEEAEFTVFIHNLGSQSGYAGLIFRNIPEGLYIVGPRCTKWVDSGTMREFDCQLVVEAEEIPPGNYTFEVGIVAAGAPPGWTGVEVTVREDDEKVADRTADLPDLEETAVLGAEEEYPPCPIEMNLAGVEEADDSEEEIPGFGIGASLGALTLLAIWGRARRR
ncbi:COG1470 family protein [Candidatus Methanocrinis natronophilus]|uniref:DUF11 domain-containing protein n=1 Tax=Candidatus Methanocrinis natronophilus TaxID=3033396 RepID=A0ABT5X7A3_9EURY|nr:hypothetical protein [Candidatus Methanocrinis natronophilus]MDF0590572.1 hypothetical protein [Candidatus Methanocrinis natronophilus]